MEKIDILLIVVFIFGAAAFFAIHWCFVLSNVVKHILSYLEIINNHSDALKVLYKLNNNFNKSLETQDKFNQCCVDNITKVDTKIISVLKKIDRIKEELYASHSPTGGRRSEAEAQN